MTVKALTRSSMLENLRWDVVDIWRFTILWHHYFLHFFFKYWCFSCFSVFYLVFVLQDTSISVQSSIQNCEWLSLLLKVFLSYFHLILSVGAKRVLKAALLFPSLIPESISFRQYVIRFSSDSLILLPNSWMTSCSFALPQSHLL